MSHLPTGDTARHADGAMPRLRQQALPKGKQPPERLHKQQRAGAAWERLSVKTKINDLAHDLWAMSQGQQSIDEAIQRIVSNLESFATLAVCIDRKRICLALPGGSSVDPQWVADMVRDGPTCGKPGTSTLLIEA